MARRLTKQQQNRINQLMGGEDGLDFWLDLVKLAEEDDEDEIYMENDEVVFYDHNIVPPNQKEQFVLNLLGNPEVSTLSPAQLYNKIREEKYLGISKRDVSTIMKRKYEPQSIHARQEDTANQTALYYSFSMIQADLIILSKNSNSQLDQWGYIRRSKKPLPDNEDYLYVLVMIDALSNYLWTFPLKKKDQRTVSERMKAVLSHFPPHRWGQLYSDNGEEFREENFNSWLEDQGTKHIYSNPYHPVSKVERANKTLKNKIFRWFTQQNTTNWKDALYRITTSYNQSTTASLPDKLTPQKAFWTCLEGSPEEISQLEEKINRHRLGQFYKRVAKNPKMEEIKEREYVRVRTKDLFHTKKETFKKSYLPQFSLDIFQVIKIYPPTTTKEQRYSVIKILEGRQEANEFRYREIEDSGKELILFRDSLYPIEYPLPDQIDRE